MSYFALLVGTMGIVTVGAAKSEINSSLTPLILYPDMRYALNQLGFRMGVLPQDNTLPSVQNVKAHQTHFHIYLQPPKLEGIHKTNALMAADAGSTNVPATSSDAPMLLASAKKMITPAIVRKINKALIDTCTASENPSYVTGHKAFLGGLSPGFSVLRTLKYNYGIEITGEVKAVITQQPAHGKIAMIGLATQSFPATPTEEFQYTPEKGFLGDDKAIIEVTVNGQKFRISYVIKVVHGDFGNACIPAGEDQGALTPDVQIAVEDMQFLQDASAPEIATSWQSLFVQNEQFLSSINLNFADLSGGALGQTTGSTITLDTTAAGNNWYIDTTPSDNSEYLPTSNPNEWVAKAGSADGTTSHSTKLANNASQVAGYAAGKMDMLSVLLHEYGHALGIDHNPDAHDYMGTTLTAGVRRLPTPDEMALMQHLIASLLPSPTGRGTEVTNDLAGVVGQPSQMASSSISEGATVATDTSLTLALSQGARGQGQNPSNVPFPSLPLGGMSLALEEQLAIRLGEQTTPAKSLVIAGLLQRNRYGGLNAVLNNSTMTQYDVAANSTLVNGSLSNAPSTGSGQAGWATQGSVTFTPSAFVTDPSTGSGRTVASFATLNEISTTQTRLSQVFMVNANDRYLSFTLSGTALDGTLPLPNPLPQAGEGVNGTASGSGLSPSDAFEVALLNANTGASLLGSNGPSTELRTGLTHSDAFLNLKGDCTEHLAQGVTRTLNADGSSTYRVDLSGMNL